MTAALNPTILCPTVDPIALALEKLAYKGSAEERGAIFTRREVVDFILDLGGYTTNKPLFKFRLLEPSFGNGSFLIPIIERLLKSWKTSGNIKQPIDALSPCICAVELHRETYNDTKDKVVTCLTEAGISKIAAIKLASIWLIQNDFLLIDLPKNFNYVIGNPPYVRQERIPASLFAEYRRRYATIYDRADLYIPFIEHSLSSLVKGGVLGFICADRWMKNRYGGPLRAYVADGFHLKIHVDMTNTPAFHSSVISYPAITIITREKSGATRLAERPEINRSALARLSGELTKKNLTRKTTLVRELTGVTAGAEPWVLASSNQIDLIRRIERSFPTLEEAGCAVGIGVATGADKAFIGRFDDMDVEPDRKLALATTRDILEGRIVWRGLGVLNPFTNEGPLVDLAHYPRFKRYLEKHKDQITKRHCARKSPTNWYRTIDRITPSLASKRKLLIPDIKGIAEVVFDEGVLYPHHNLYCITSDEWDLRSLQAVLLSDIAQLFISVYSTRMQGGYMRFQAQYLRRIRIPFWKNVAPLLRQQLKKAAETRDLAACNRAALILYGMNQEEQLILDRNGVGNGA